MIRIGSDSFIRVRAPIAISERDGISEYRDWDNATETVFTDVMVQPFKMAEKLNFEISFDREYIRTALRFLMNGDQDILPTDRVLWKDYQLEVFGHPQRWYRFNGQIRYTGFIGRIQEG